MLPIVLDVRGQLAVVVGGGPVGRRKAERLLASGCRVRLVCPAPRPADLAADGLDWVNAAYAPAHLEGARLVIAAATDAVNQLVVADARARGLWVNDAIHPDRGDFFLPAVLRRGDLCIAVAAGGHAPALARSIRDQLADQFDDAYADWVALLGEMRALARDRIDAPERRRALLESLAGGNWLEHLRREGIDATRGAMRALLDQIM